MKELKISESKSIANRHLIISSFLDEKLPEFVTRARDVTLLHRALCDFKKGAHHFRIEDGGTTFRFLLSRISRESGEFFIECSERVLQRPNQELFSCLEQLGVQLDIRKSSVAIKTQGWNSVSLKVDCSKSTQFASSLLLSSLCLPFNFELKCHHLNSSQPYFDMTLSLLGRRGVKFLRSENQIQVLSQQSPRSFRLEDCEVDMSSLASLLCVCIAARQDFFLKNHIEKSLQPDRKVFEFLKNMGVVFKSEEENLYCKSSEVFNLKPIKADLTHCPDLLPVMASLCATAQGESVLQNVEVTRWKESNRLQKSQDLLNAVGVESWEKDGNLHIEGVGRKELKELGLLTPVVFNCDQDHRMAMAAAVLKAAGYRITIETPEVVEKSFPDFWKISEVTPC